jgi:hypothetical protein
MRRARSDGAGTVGFAVVNAADDPKHALADRLAQHLDKDPNNYLSPRGERVRI